MVWGIVICAIIIVCLSIYLVNLKNEIKKNEADLTRLRKNNISAALDKNSQVTELQKLNDSLMLKETELQKLREKLSEKEIELDKVKRNYMQYACGFDEINRQAKTDIKKLNDKIFALEQELNRKNAETEKLNKKDIVDWEFDENFVNNSNEKDYDKFIWWYGAESSHVKRISHDHGKSILYVEFKDGTIYSYENVNNDLFNKFLKAKSLGKFLRSEIMPFYKSECVKKEEKKFSNVQETLTTEGEEDYACESVDDESTIESETYNTEAVKEKDPPAINQTKRLFKEFGIDENILDLNTEDIKNEVVKDLKGFDRGLAKDINEIRKVANITYASLSLNKDVDDHYNSLSFYEIVLSSATQVRRIVDIVCKVDTKPLLLMIRIDKNFYLCCGNINYCRKETSMKYISNSFDLDFSTYNSEQMLARININNMKECKLLFDYIFNIAFAISANSLKYIHKSKASRIQTYFEMKGVVGKCKTRKVGKKIFVESETFFRELLKADDQNYIKNNYRDIYDIAIDMRRSRQYVIGSVESKEEDEDDFPDF